MWALPFLILVYYLACKWEIRCDEKLRKHKEIERWCKKEQKKIEKYLNGSSVKNPKYRVQEVDSEDDELFTTDLGDFDDTFK